MHRASYPASLATRLATRHLGALGDNLATTIGSHSRQRLVWLSILATPLLFPVALPGMALAVGSFCVLIGIGLMSGQLVPLPRVFESINLNGQVKGFLTAAVTRSLKVVSGLSQPRLLALTKPTLRPMHGLMLSLAGLSMMTPVPVISFDNVLPALAIVLIAWGLRLRDGLLLLAGYLVTPLAVGSVLFFWLGGAYAVTLLFTNIR